jgi:hypothetical protein
MKTHPTKRSLFPAICLAALIALNPVAYAAGADSTAPSGAAAMPPELSLNDVEDAGMLLRFIGQQAINLYEEASRTKLGVNSVAEIPDIRSIPVKTTATNFLPPRQEWLVFYVGSIEPVIRQLSKHVADIQAGTKQVVIPEEDRKKLEPLWEAWTSGVTALNAHLDKLVPLFDDAAHNNTKIQALSVEIFDDVQHLESVRKSVFRAMQLMMRKGDEKILLSPPD